MTKMTAWGAKQELESAVLHINRVARATGNAQLRASCRMITEMLEPLAENMACMNFDGYNDKQEELGL